jgi:endoglucanase
MRKKRLTAIVLAAVLTMGLAACGNAGTGSSDNAGTESMVQEEQEVAESPSDAGTESDADMDQEDAPVTESSLKGTGPATKEDAFSSEGGNESAQLKDGDVVVDVNFDDNDVDGFVTYTNFGHITQRFVPAFNEHVGSIHQIGIDMTCLDDFVIIKDKTRSPPYLRGEVIIA